MSNLVFFLTGFSTYLHTENTVRNITKIDQIENFGLPKMGAVSSNFCLIGKNRCIFLVPRIIKLACQTFMPIQTLDQHRVGYLALLLHSGCFCLILSNNYRVFLSSKSMESDLISLFFFMDMIFLICSLLPKNDPDLHMEWWSVFLNKRYMTIFGQNYTIKSRVLNPPP